MQPLKKHKRTRLPRTQASRTLRLQHCMREPLSVDQDATIEEVAKTLHERHVGSVVVVDKRRRCLGICTERDVIRALASGIPVNAPVKKIMTRKPITISEQDTVAKARSIMSTHGIRHLPVVNENQQLVGIVSARSLLEDFLGVSS